MKSAHLLLLPSAFFLLTFLPACTLLKENPPPNRHSYSLHIPAPAPTATPPATPLLISIPTFTIAPEFANRSIVHRLTDTQYAADYYNTFIVSPNDLLAEKTRAYLRAEKSFAVTPPNALPNPDLTLSAHIITLCADDRPNNNNTALTVRFTLLRNSDNKLLLEKTYTSTTPYTPADRASPAASFSTNLQQLLQQLLPDLQSSTQ